MSGNGEEARQETGRMMVVSQTQLGAASQKVDALKPKRRTRVACWNVRTLYQTGKLAQVVREFDEYRLDILGVSEARWSGSGKRRLASGHTILYSGRADDQHTEGVAMIITSRMEKALLEWKPISPRLLKARFNSRYTKLSVIVCYAPIEDAEEEDKENFYNQLQATTEEVKTHDMLLIIGDMNARVGGDNRGREGTIGKHGLGVMNDNGGRLCDFCEENDLTIGGSLFQHKTIHKNTWTSPDGATKTQIDHIIINKKWKNSMRDVKVCRGADIASDHNLVVGVLSLKLRKAMRDAQRPRQLDSSKLENDVVRKAFSIEVKNRYRVLGEEQEMTIDKMNQALKEAGEKVLGFRKKKKEEWIQLDTWQKIDERKETKQKINSTRSERMKQRLRTTYSELDKQVKRQAKRDKKLYIERLADEAEEAAKGQDLKTLYQITKTLKGSFNSGDGPVKDKEGNFISSEQGKTARWKEHFEEVLNRPEPTQTPVILPADEDLDIATDPPTEEEIKQAMKTLKNGKAAGVDGVTAEMLRAEETMTTRLLAEMFQKIWEDESAPATWKTGLIVKLPKKGNLADCNNWRGITLLSLTSKIFSKVIHNRLSKALGDKLREEQTGFRPGKSCSDHIFTLRQILEQSNEWNAPLYANFVDMEKAFDSIHRESLWKILRHYGVPQKIVNVVKMLYGDFSSRVINNNTLSDAFKVNTGVKQGCNLSPFLFVLGMDWIMRTTIGTERRGVRWNFTSILEDLDFADDVALLAHRHQDMQEKTSDMASTAGQIGLKISSKKTKHMRMNNKNNTAITVNGEALEEVEYFTYLGSKMTTDGDSEKEVRERISKASQAFASLKTIWRTRKISTKTKLRLFKSNVLSILLYGAESWKMTKGISHKLEVFQNRCLRRLLRIFWPNTISNSELHERANAKPITLVVRARRWRWIGHVLRMPQASLPRIALRWTPDGRRKRGRPKETWRRTVEREMKEQGWTWNFLERCAVDRPRWRALVSALCTTACEED